MDPLTIIRSCWRPALYAMLGILLLRLSGMVAAGRTLEGLCYDHFTRIAPVAAATDELLIVAIDEPSFQEIGLAWPWPRTLHAELVDRLHEAGARVIVFDVVFAEPSDAAADQALAAAMARAGNVVLAATMERAESSAFLREVLILPQPLLRAQAAAVGMAMVRPDEDGVVRRFATAFEGLPSLPQAVVDLAGDGNGKTLSGGLIGFAGPGMTIPHVSYSQILDREHRHPSRQIRGKIVLVGKALAVSPDPLGSTDAFRTPFSTVENPTMAGTEIQAAVIRTLLSGSARQEVRPVVRHTAGAAVVALLAFSLFRLKPLLIVVLGGGAAAVCLAVSLFLFVFPRLWFPPVMLSLGCLAVSGAALADGYVVASRQRAWIKNAFSRYISPEVVRMLTAHPERLRLGGEEVEATVMFMDLAGFTSLSEKLPPKEVILLLSEVFAPLTEIIKGEHGTLDKFIGDAIMAFWGAPLPQPDHAVRACRAALAMQQKLREISETLGRRSGAVVHARIGLHSGTLVVGNVGSREQFNYTCLGDTVNLASRLESANKVYGSEILLSGETAAQLDGSLVVRQLDRLRVKGRAEATTVFELLAGQPQSAWLNRFERARTEYAAGNFAAAAALFEEILEEWPDDRPSRELLRRCRAFLEVPPAPEWDGIWPASGGGATAVR
jgi:adenylate cyclase